MTENLNLYEEESLKKMNRKKWIEIGSGSKKNALFTEQPLWWKKLNRESDSKNWLDINKIHFSLVILGKYKMFCNFLKKIGSISRDLFGFASFLLAEIKSFIVFE